MWSLFVFVPLLLLASLAAAVVVDKEIKAIVDSLFAPDLFHRFLQAYPPNASIDPCDNFYRHICPVNLPKQYGFRNVLARQSTILRTVQELNIQDDFDYTALTNLYTDLTNGFKMNTVLDDTMNNQIRERCYDNGGKRCILHIARTTLPVLLKIRQSEKKPAILRELNRIRRKLLNVVDEIATESLIAFTVSIMQMYHDRNIFTEENTLFLINAVADRLAFLSFVKRGGMMNEEFARKEEEIAAEIREEIARDAMRYTWSREENRFGVRTGEMFAQHLRWGMDSYLPMDRRDLHNERLRHFATKLLDDVRYAENVVGSPDKHVNRMAVTANALFMSGILTREELERTGMFPKVNALSSKRGFAVFSPAILLRFMHNVPDAVKYGGMYGIYAHETQHQLQFLTEDAVEHNAFYAERKKCLSAYMRDICDASLFKEVECHSGEITFKEDDADQVGVRTAARLFWKHRHDSLKEKPYADFNITNEELFFVARAIFRCADFEGAQHNRTGTEWNEHSAKYVRPNSVFAAMDEFRNVYKCELHSKMAQPNAFFLERNKNGQYPEVLLDACPPETSGYNYV